MALATSNSAAADPDMSLINELFEEITRSPPGIEARKVLIQQFIQVGWIEAAYDATTELLILVPHDTEAKAFLELFPNDENNQDAPPPPAYTTTPKPIPQRTPVELPDDLIRGQASLGKDYEALRSRAKALLSEMRLLRDLHQQQKGSTPSSLDKHIPDLAGLADGRITSTVRPKQPGSARFVARAMEAEPQRAVDIAANDLTDMARWLRSSTELDDDGVREALAKRVKALIAALPAALQPRASTAQMHIEHEVLNRSYVCSETMLGDPVADIPRSNFLVTEDGYAWDLEELAQAISSNSGVMRNPLSKQMFTPADITAIIDHPLGKNLGALQIEQSKLSKGVRPTTIEKLDELSKLLLADQSDDAIPSRKATDEFIAYLATLPRAEQNAIDKLRVPAKDSHTGLAFDSSVGEAVRDAAGNRMCFHKTGDFLRQAATHLRRP